MALPSFGNPISLGDINVELGRTRTSLISLDAAESEGYGQINLDSTNKPNANRPAAISEWYGYDHSATSAAYLNISPTIQNVFSGAITYDITVDSNVSWAVSSPVSWASVSKINSTTARVSVDENTTLQSRTTDIEFTHRDLTSSVFHSLTQEPGDGGGGTIA